MENEKTEHELNFERSEKNKPYNWTTKELEVFVEMTLQLAFLMASQYTLVMVTKHARERAMERGTEALQQMLIRNRPLILNFSHESRVLMMAGPKQKNNPASVLISDPVYGHLVCRLNTNQLTLITVYDGEMTSKAQQKFRHMWSYSGAAYRQLRLRDKHRIKGDPPSEEEE